MIGITIQIFTVIARVDVTHTRVWVVWTALLPPAEKPIEVSITVSLAIVLIDTADLGNLGVEQREREHVPASLPRIHHRATKSRLRIGGHLL